MPNLRIELTGQVPGILRARQPTAVAALQRLQTRLALAVLVLERDTPPSKHRMADILWPDGPPPTWETALRGTVSRVRAALIEAGLAKDAVTSSPTGLRVCLPAGAVVDVELAAADLAAAEQALVHGDHERAYASACAAGAIARAPLLPDCGGEWVEQWRARLASWLQRAQVITAESATALGRYPAAVAAAEDALSADPYAEWAFRVLMRVRAAAGERAAALDVYERCRRRLRDDLGVNPSAETEAAYLELLGADPSVADSRFPLVGRRAELAILAAEWARVSAAGPRAVVLVGEPGAGKSRLAGEFAASLEAAGHLVLRGREDGRLSVPFRPFADALADYLGARGSAVLDELGAAAAGLARLRESAPTESFTQPHGMAGPGRLRQCTPGCTPPPESSRSRSWSRTYSGQARQACRCCGTCSPTSTGCGYSSSRPAAWAMLPSPTSPRGWPPCSPPRRCAAWNCPRCATSTSMNFSTRQWAGTCPNLPQ